MVGPRAHLAAARGWQRPVKIGGLCSGGSSGRFNRVKAPPLGLRVTIGLSGAPSAYQRHHRPVRGTTCLSKHHWRIRSTTDAWGVSPNYQNRHKSARGTTDQSGASLACSGHHKSVRVPPIHQGDTDLSIDTTDPLGLLTTNLSWTLEPFSGVEIHMEMDMEWKWMEMGHNLWKCYGLVWIWEGHQLKTIR